MEMCVFVFGDVLAIAIVNDALSCLTAVCLCICIPFTMITLCNDKLFHLTAGVLVCVFTWCFWVNGWFLGVIYMPMPRPRPSAQSMQIGLADCGYWRHSDKVYSGWGSSAYRSTWLLGLNLIPRSRLLALGQLSVLGGGQLR